jgi:ActR/RegA family two-component response regulator
MISTLDTHELVKDLKAAGFNDDQAEAVTRAVAKGRDIDLSYLATKADLANSVAQLRTEMTELKADLIKWVVGIAFAQIATIVAILKLFPGGHP